MNPDDLTNVKVKRREFDFVKFGEISDGVWFTTMLDSKSIYCKIPLITFEDNVEYNAMIIYNDKNDGRFLISFSTNTDIKIIGDATIDYKFV